MEPSQRVSSKDGRHQLSIPAYSHDSGRVFSMGAWILSAFVQPGPNAIKRSYCGYKRNSLGTSGCTCDPPMIGSIALPMATWRVLNRTWFKFDPTCCTFGPKWRRLKCSDRTNNCLFSWADFNMYGRLVTILTSKPCKDGNTTCSWVIHREERNDS